MEFLKSYHERALDTVRLPTLNTFIPLLEKNRAAIESIQRESMKYGDTERHTLDVYYPRTQDAAKKPPILIFVYGGSFIMGDRVRPPPEDLIYTCVGAFYASRGFLTVIPDYRLVPFVKYPQPVEDIRDALAFVVSHFGDVGDTDNIFMHGHSAGGSIATSLLLAEPALISAEMRKRVKGVMSIGAPLYLPGPAEGIPIPEFITQLYGDKYQQLCPAGLLRSASPETFHSLPPLYITRAEKEPPELVMCHNKFMEAVRECSLPNVTESIAAFHNHSSPSMSLSSGETELEAYAEDFILWIKKILAQ